MTENEIKIAKTMFVKQIPDTIKGHIKKILMYGSCARGDYSDDSDIDIAILTDSSRSENKKYDDALMDAVTNIAMETDAIVEYVCIPYDEFEQKKSWYGYFKNIEKEGELLYG